MKRMTKWSVCAVAAALFLTSGCRSRNRDSRGGEVIMIDGGPVPLTALYADDATPIVMRARGRAWVAPGPGSHYINRDRRPR